jgi:phenylalanyl-tRNA synthetase beta chain
MYISLDWINELVSLENIELEELIEKLTLGGFEVEEILTLIIDNQEKIILDISATANRADSLSIKGITKEVLALTNEIPIKSIYSKTNLKYQQVIQDTFKCSSKSVDCSTFMAITVENLVDLTIPKWVTSKLLCSGVEPSNTLLDFQTYILLETGYPFEFYDLTKIEKILQTSDITLGLKSKNIQEPFTANNNLEYQCDSDILILEANGYPLSIAGIIPNKTVSYTKQTTSLLVEASIFNSKKIRQQSRKLGLRTERSARYEKGLNTSSFIESVIKLINLLRIHNTELVCTIHTTTQVDEPKKSNILLSYDNIIEILGPINIKTTNEIQNLTPFEISEYLNRLNFIFTFNENESTWSVEIPIARINDIEREIDLIEEIGRLHGFNNFTTNLPDIYKIGDEDLSYQVRKKITSCFLNEGFNELVQYSLVNEQRSNSIKLVNPLVKDCSTLRTSLLPNLVKIVADNSKQGNLVFEGFEYGHIFSGNINSAYIEKEVVSGIFGGLNIKRKWDETANVLSWFEAKGKIEELFNKLNIKILWKNSKQNNDKKILHPYRTAELYVEKGNRIGIFGQIHPIIAKTQNISPELFLFEFDLEIINNEFKNLLLSSYTRYSLYPKITKDLSFSIDRKYNFTDIKRTLTKNATKYLKHIELLDEYRNNSIPETHTSLCIQLVFQSIEKTLITEEVDSIIQNLQTILQNEYNVNIRI